MRKHPAPAAENITRHTFVPSTRDFQPARRRPTQLSELPQLRTHHLPELPQLCTQQLSELPQLRTHHLPELPQLCTQHLSELPQLRTHHLSDLPQLRTHHLSDLPQLHTHHLTELLQLFTHHLSESPQPRSIPIDLQAHLLTLRQPSQHSWHDNINIRNSQITIPTTTSANARCHSAIRFLHFSLNMPLTGRSINAVSDLHFTETTPQLLTDKPATVPRSTSAVSTTCHTAL
jgi:hypothetical protein